MTDLPIQSQPSDRLSLQLQSARDGMNSSTHIFCTPCYCFSDDERR
jgi:hypothetical protein